MRPRAPGPAPATSASFPGTPLTTGVDDDDDALPPPPGVVDVVGAAIAGVVVGVMTTITTVCVWRAASWDLPDAADVYGNGAFFAGAAVVLVIALSSWWRALSSRRRDPARWMGLSLPFFVVAGVAGGAAVVGAVAPVSDEDTRARWQCERLLGVYGEHLPVVQRCAAVARPCRDEARRTTNRLASADACIRDRLR